MAEGSFDKDGHYHFKKDTEIRDNWLDNIDWVCSNHTLYFVIFFNLC